MRHKRRRLAGKEGGRDGGGGGGRGSGNANLLKVHSKRQARGQASIAASCCCYCAAVVVVAHGVANTELAEPSSLASCHVSKSGRH